MKSKKALRAAGVAAAASAAAALSAYCTTKFLVRVAVDREEPRVTPKAGRLLSRAQADDSFLEGSKAAAERLKARENEVVTITGRDGTPLVGHFIPCENARRVIIAMHGWRSSWAKDFGLMADFWEQNQCSVLYAEQRGQNSSGGDHIGFGLTERYDVLDWISWAAERCGKELPVYLAGVSMGATTVLMAAGLELPGNVHGIVADCGFTSPDAIWKHVVSNNLHLACGLRSVMADAMFRERLQMSTKESSTVEALRSCKTPVLLIHGTADRFVPVEMTYENYMACAAPKQLLIVPGAGHGMSYFTEQQRYEKAVKEFWGEFDQPAFFWGQ